ncbi:unnamed protein product [Nippostrongylus brasiliensis]|uniref:Methylmalonyl-CoA carboxyltransferase n=1 Tax=Nippostrongylus brasiliensis TaxID=27835 RepID=A0A0N4XUZ0_NIPBR|nr:unnamed protein product [Nippostrongylus brasiliensis]
MNMDNDMKEELIRRRRAAWSAFGSLKEATDQLQDADYRAHLFDSTVPINKLDDDRETTKRMELVLGPARSVKPGHLSI